VEQGLLVRIAEEQTLETKEKAVRLAHQGMVTQPHNIVRNWNKEKKKRKKEKEAKTACLTHGTPTKGS
jgi:hypothetical protein